MQTCDVGWQASAQARRVGWLLHARDVEIKCGRLARAAKANFDPNQPRVSAGNPDGGRWTRTGGGSGGGLRGVPEQRPTSDRLRNIAIKLVAGQVALVLRAREELRGSVRHVLDLLEVASWVHEALPLIQSYADPAKTLEELQRAVQSPDRGYNIHHIVEQTPAAQDGFPRSMIDSPENLVRVPTLKHHQVTGWYMKANDNFGGLSPRNYLHGKDWETRVKVGLEALVRHGVLRP